jgi:hypothetical protein
LHPKKLFFLAIVILDIPDFSVLQKSWNGNLNMISVVFSRSQENGY